MYKLRGESSHCTLGASVGRLYVNNEFDYIFDDRKQGKTLAKPLERD